MHINLGRTQICVSQPLLELERRDPLLRFVSRERMPQGVTARFLGNTCFFAILHDEFANPPLGYRLTLVINPTAPLRSCRQCLSALRSSGASHTRKEPEGCYQFAAPQMMCTPFHHLK